MVDTFPDGEQILKVHLIPGLGDLYTLSLSAHSFGQSQSQGQPTLGEREEGCHSLIEKAVDILQPFSVVYYCLPSVQKSFIFFSHSICALSYPRTPKNLLQL